MNSALARVNCFGRAFMFSVGIKSFKMAFISWKGISKSVFLGLSSSTSMFVIAILSSMVTKIVSLKELKTEFCSGVMENVILLEVFLNSEMW